MSALGNKGEKNQGKFKAIDINNLFKGSSVTPQKPAPAANRQHGLQSLGKVANIRRMPPPANLPSLRSENSGSDSNLTPPVSSAASGWTKDDTTVMPDSPVAGSPVAAATTTTHLKPTQPPPVQAISHPPKEPASAQVSDASQNQHLSAHANPLWSSVMSAGRRPGSFLDQKSAMFHEEFPQLAQGSDEKTPMARGEDENKEALHGPGLNLRPQNVGNWREGGGRTASSPLAVAAGSSESGGGTAADEESTGSSPRPPSVDRHPLAVSPGFCGPVPPMMAMRPGMPPHTGQMPMMPPNFRGVPMMPFGFRPGFPPTYPPNFIPPGMPRPPFVNPADFRFPGMYPPGAQPWNYMRFPGAEEAAAAGGGTTATTAAAERPLIVKEKDLEGFDKLKISDDGWAGAHIDVDFSEKIIFSDEEDTDTVPEKSHSKAPAVERQSSDGSGRSSERDYRSRGGEHNGAGQQGRQHQELHDARHERVVSFDKQLSSDASGSPVTPKEAWMPSGAAGPFTARLPAPQPASVDRRQWRPEVQFELRAPQFQQQAFLQRPPFRPQLDAPGGSGGLEADDDEMWRQRRKVQSDNMTAAIERARQRREEEERRMKEEQLAAAREKLRQLDEKVGKKTGDKDSTNDRERLTGSRDDIRRSESSEKIETGPVSNARMSQKLPKATDSLPNSSSSELDLNDSVSRLMMSSSPSGSVSPRPPQLPLQAPPRLTQDRPGSYWPYDVRAWGPVPGGPVPRYMMDPRYIWHMQHGMAPMMMPPRRPPPSDVAAEGHDEAQQDVSVDASVGRPMWMDQSGYCMHPALAGGHYDQQMLRAAAGQAALGYYGLLPADYSQKDYKQSEHGYPASAGGGCIDDSSSLPASGSVRSRSFSDDDAALSHAVSNDATTSSGEYDRLSASGTSLSEQHLSTGTAEPGSSTVTVRRPPGTELSNRGAGTQLQQGAELPKLKESQQLQQQHGQPSHDTRSKKETDRGQRASGSNRSMTVVGQAQDNKAMEQTAIGPSSSDVDQSSCPGGISAGALKRTHSSASTCSSIVSNERRTDSPKETVLTAPSEQSSNLSRSYSGQLLPQKSLSKESVSSNQSSKTRDSQTNLKEEDLNTCVTTGPGNVHSGKRPETKYSDLAAEKTAAATVVAGCEPVQRISPTESSKLNGSVDRPPVKRMKDGARPYHRKNIDRDSERVRLSTGSREFVRGGRGRVRSSVHGRGCGYTEDEHVVYAAGSKPARSGVGGGGTKAAEDDGSGFVSENGRVNSATMNATGTRSNVARDPPQLRMDMVTNRLGSDIESQRREGSLRDAPRDQRNEIPAEMGMRNEPGAGSRRNEVHPSNRRNFRNDRPASQKADFEPNALNEMQPSQPGDSAVSRGGGGSGGPRQQHSGGRMRGSGGSSGGGRSQGNSRQSADQRQWEGGVIADSAVNSSAVSSTTVNREDFSSNPAAVMSGVDGAVVTSGIGKLSSQRPPGSRHRHRRGARQRPPATACGTAVTSSSSGGVGSQSGEATGVSAGEYRPDPKPDRRRAAADSRPGNDDDGRFDERIEQSRRGGGGGGGPAPPRESNPSRNRRKDTSARKPQTLPDAAVATYGTSPPGGGIIHEEWETASEGSDVLRNSSQQQSRRDRDRPMNASGSGERRDGGKKSFSNQRAGYGGRRGRRKDHHSTTAAVGGETASASAGTGSQTKLGGGTASASGANGRPNQARANGSVMRMTPPVAGNTPSGRMVAAEAAGPNGTAHAVYRLDHVSYNNPSDIERLFDSCFSRQQSRSWCYTEPPAFMKNSVGNVVEMPSLLDGLTSLHKFKPLDTAELCPVHVSHDRHDSGIELSDVTFSLSGCSTPVDELVDCCFSDAIAVMSDASCDLNAMFPGSTRWDCAGGIDSAMLPWLGLTKSASSTCTEFWNTDDVVRMQSSLDNIWSPCKPEDPCQPDDEAAKIRFHLPLHYGTLISRSPDFNQDATVSVPSDNPLMSCSDDIVLTAGVIGSHLAASQRNSVPGLMSAQSTMTSGGDMALQHDGNVLISDTASGHLERPTGHHLPIGCEPNNDDNLDVVVDQFDSDEQFSGQ